ncbi:MAG: lysozyme [Zoogloeaceae bacterium]|jgi:lysozyme|nr:lysozyme [Zoogloeaceae bacterium]
MNKRLPIALAFAAALSGGLLVFTGQHEGLRTEAYADPAHGWNVPTICYGHTAGVAKGDRATLDACRVFLREDYRPVGAALERLVQVPVTENQALALADLVFNIGEGAFAKSTLLKKLNAGDYEGAAAEFDRWVYANGKKLPGLVKRRAAERKLFEGDAS